MLVDNQKLQLQQVKHLVDLTEEEKVVQELIIIVVMDKVAAVQLMFV